ncbi:endonuclease domain-containing protein [Agromyces cerinus]|uniref:DUF559 domain-containing protein n=1 Tax=Agromyces cerinus subsp. cerinus TaxID=232089 RepID=A0A1N6HNL8_9MICO|nr:hypothetical protein [Agromyces cerinus]SIO21347.1 hypothetical protein SAMN05443544_3354 [Agromyces cerinus subsp. cerinus]
MRRPAQLPPELADGGVFGLEDARRLGLTRGRLAAGDLSTPFRGSRMVVGTDRSIRHLALAYAARMPDRQFFSHATAALLNGVPLPTAVERDPRLDVSVFEGAPRPRVRGVVGHVLEPTRTTVLAAGRLRMTDAATTWCQLGARLGVDDLVAAGDFMVTGRDPVGGRAPMVRVTDLVAAAERHRGSSGVARLRIALPLIRYGPLSRRETRLRLVIVRAGLPEPEINHVVRDPRLGGWEPMIDLAYPRHRVGIEYEGDHHRDPRQFRADIRRYERLQDVGWSFVRVTAADLPEQGGDGASVALTRRIAARLESRGWRTR